MTLHSRRHFLQGSLALAAISLQSGCDLPRLPWQPAKVPRIGFLATGARPGRQLMIDGLLEGLRERGYEEGRDLLVEYRFSDDDNSRLPVLATELVALNVDLIVASGTPASTAARDATTTIPVVMGGLAAHPIEGGFIESFNRPGGNITGMSLMTTQLSGKRLELFKEIVPGLTRVAILWNPPNLTYGPLLREFDAVAPTLELEIYPAEARVPQDFEPAIQAAIWQGAGALIAPGDPLTTNNMPLLAELAFKYRMPTLMEYREFTDAGGLLAQGPNLADSYRRCADHVDKILKGANPAELPMQLPAKLDLVVNLKTAQALGLTIPETILLQAEVIQ